MARKEVSPVEITRAVLDRAERLQPELNCFITICGDQALSEAQVAELLGVTVGTVKSQAAKALAALRAQAVLADHYSVGGE